MPWPRLLWRRALIYTHRWLGIGGCVLFAVWFVSGIVMMYARMPGLSLDERVARLAPLAWDAIRVAPGDAARQLESPPTDVRLAMFAGRPVYRFRAGRVVRGVFADSGEPVPAIDDATARAVARPFGAGGQPQVNARLTQPDQWTVSGAVRAEFPLTRVALDDRDGTELYIGATGEPVLRTTAVGRRLAYVGAVFHWLYFTPLRRRGALWSAVIIDLSLAGCLMCASGLVWGLWRWSIDRAYRLRRVASRTPYSGWMKWHHYAGLLFGLTTFTWIFSGLLSMDPWDWHPGNSPTAAMDQALSGGPLALEAIAVEDVRAGARALVREFGARELTFVQFRHRMYLSGVRSDHPVVRGWTDNDRTSYLTPSATTARRLVALGPASSPLFTQFADDTMREAVVDAMPGAAVEDEVWLDRYDAYYYDRHGALPLPVLRVRFQDPQRTWLYADPRIGALVLKEERWSRANRWLYHGLHSLDFPWIYDRRPLWDVLVIALSLGGLASTVTAIAPGWRRVARLVRSGGWRARHDLADH